VQKGRSTFGLISQHVGQKYPFSSVSKRWPHCLQKIGKKMFLSVSAQSDATSLVIIEQIVPQPLPGAPPCLFCSTF